jgi:hypothetical protein
LRLLCPYVIIFGGGPSGSLACGRFCGDPKIKAQARQLERIGWIELSVDWDRWQLDRRSCYRPTWQGDVPLDEEDEFEISIRKRSIILPFHTALARSFEDLQGDQPAQENMEILILR